MVQHITDRITIGGQAIDRATFTGIKVASANTGVSFQYLLAKAAQESSLKTDAQAEGSSAAGLFQFTRGTWLEMVKRYGADTGLNDLAQKILTGADGRALVNDKDIESRILSLREDPEVSALMAAHYARDNASALEGVLGRAPDASDLYLAHFLGPAGAGLLLGTAADKPATAAAALMPAASACSKAKAMKSMLSRVWPMNVRRPKAYWRVKELLTGRPYPGRQRGKPQRRPWSSISPTA